MRPVVVAGHEVKCFRVSFTGLLGYELHCDAGAAVDVYEHLRRHPATAEMPHFGGHAQNALRVEKGFKLRGDLDYAHYTEVRTTTMMMMCVFSLDFSPQSSSFILLLIISSLLFASSMSRRVSVLSFR